MIEVWAVTRLLSEYKLGGVFLFETIVRRCSRGNCGIYILSRLDCDCCVPALANVRIGCKIVLQEGPGEHRAQDHRHSDLSCETTEGMWNGGEGTARLIYGRGYGPWGMPLTYPSFCGLVTMFGDRLETQGQRTRVEREGGVR